MIVTVRFRFVLLLLATLDALVAAGCAFAAYKLRFHPFTPWSLTVGHVMSADRPYFHMMFFAPFFRLASGYLTGLYRHERRGYRFGEDIPRIFRAVSLGTALLVILAFFGAFQYQAYFGYRDFTYARFFFFFDWLLNLLCLVAIHPMVGILRTEVARRGVGARRLAIQGIGHEARLLASQGEALRENGYELVGMLTEDPGASSLDLKGEAVPCLGGASDILRTINTHNIHEIVVTNVGALGCDFLSFAEACHKVDVVVQLAPNLQGLLFQNQPVHDLAGIPMIQVNEVAITGLPYLLKRLEDIVLSIAVLVLLSPIILLTAVAIRMDSPGPVIFAQRRTGKHGRIFRMFKFRSMYRDAEERREQLAHLNESDGPIFKIRDDPRITRVGRLIRKTSVDELPQLFNVLKGDMSLIGPRPLPASDIDAPDAWEATRFAAMPGITGMWQVNRVDHSSEEMLKWDLYYVENWSLWLDMKILVKTIVVVLRGKGAY